MKKLFVLFSMCLCFSRSYCTGATGSPYTDAVTFLAAINGDRINLPDVLGILSYYSDSKVSTISSADSIMKNNYFLAGYANKMMNSTLAPASPSSITSDILGMNVTNLADGIAKFLIERGKQELSTAFFDGFKKDLVKYPELKFIFPQTTDIINKIQSFNVQTLLQQLRDAFIKDLNTMPTNILSLRNINNFNCDPKDNQCLNRVKVINDAFSTTAKINPSLFIVPLNIMQGVIDGGNITDIMDKVVADQSVCAQNDDLSGYIKIVSLLLQALKSSGGGTSTGVFINQTQLKSLFSSSDLMSVFLGLVYQKYSNTVTNPCYSSTTISGKNLLDIFKAILTTKNQFYFALTKFNQINTAYNTITSRIKNGQNIDASIYTSFTASSITVINDLINGIALLKLSPVDSSNNITTITTTYNKLKLNVNIASNFCIDVQQRNYAGIFNDVIKLIDENNIIQNTAAEEKIVKYLSFASNLASATSSDEVKNAIESVALPPGSYSVKQKSAFNICINGYIGYSLDYNGGAFALKNNLYAKGIYAPIGFTGSVGLGKRHQWALSLFTAVLDVGGVVSYRLTNGPTDSLKQEIRLESIISPSAQLMIGIPKTPIAFCAGWKLTPKLFYDNEQTFQAVKAKSVFNLSVLIDIPIITLFNKPYNN